MKPLFIADLKDGQAVSSLFLVSSKEIRTSAKTGRSWLQLELSDRTGRIDGKMWDKFEDATTRFVCQDIVKVQGRAKMYNDQIELTVEQILPAQEADYDLADFLPHTKEDVEKLYAQLREFIVKAGNPWIKRLLASVVEDPAIAPKLKRAPAAMTMHHAFIGGLLEHTVSVIGLMQGVADHYPELDRDLLLAGIVLHDIGKIEELSYARGFRVHHRRTVDRAHRAGTRSRAEEDRSDSGFSAAAGHVDRALDFEPSWLARIWLAAIAAVSRSRCAALFGRFGFEDGGDAGDA